MYIFSEFTYNEYIGPYFLSHVVSKIFASAPPPTFDLKYLKPIKYPGQGWVASVLGAVPAHLNTCVLYHMIDR